MADHDAVEWTRLRDRLMEVTLQERQLMAYFDRRVAALLGLNLTSSKTLETIELAGAIPAGRLAREMHLSNGATTAIVDGLVTKGYARRFRPAEDRRQILIEITERAREERERATGGSEMEDQMLTNWSAEDLRTVLEFYEESFEWYRRRLAALEPREE